MQPVLKMPTVTDAIKIAKRFILFPALIFRALRKDANVLIACFSQQLRFIAKY